LDALKPEIELEMVDVYKIKPEDLVKWDVVICGIPTWDVGELEYGWNDIYLKLDDVDLSNVTVIMFGLGDQASYVDTYQDAMGILYKKFLERGATGGIGFTATDTHEFDESLGVIDGMFCGLALDDDNQEELTEERIQEWAAALKQEWPGLVERFNESCC
jgi:flavodoxin I